MDMLIEEELLRNIQKDAYELAMSAGKLLQKYFRDPLGESKVLKISYKDAKGRDPVTAADKEVQEYLSEQIKKDIRIMGSLVKREIQPQIIFLI